MQHAAFKSPLNDAGLAELGRATLNWGFADMLAGMLIEMLLGIRDIDAKRHLLSPLMIGKKIDVLRKCLHRIEQDDVRALALKFCDEISSLNSGRNHAVHGFWGWETAKDGEAPRAAASSHKSKKPFYAEEISGVADRIAAATILAHNALTMLGGKPSEGIQYPVTFWFGPVPPHGETTDKWEPLGGGEANFRSSGSQN